MYASAADDAARRLSCVDGRAAQHAHAGRPPGEAECY